MYYESVGKERKNWCQLYPSKNLITTSVLFLSGQFLFLITFYGRIIWGVARIVVKLRKSMFLVCNSLRYFIFIFWGSRRKMKKVPLKQNNSRMGITFSFPDKLKIINNRPLAVIMRLCLFSTCPWLSYIFRIYRYSFPAFLHVRMVNIFCTSTLVVVLVVH